ncbi:MAG: hypothetical protein ACLT1W_11865 [Alistipes onderdonkii]
MGSQQRSDSEFIHAANLCREGKLGKIELIKPVWAVRHARQTARAGSARRSELGQMARPAARQSTTTRPSSVITSNRTNEQLWAHGAGIMARAA